MGLGGFNLKEYFLFIFIIDNKEYYCIWYTNERDGFITESNKVKYFDGNEQLYIYSNSNNIKIEEGKTVLSIDNAIIWLQQNEKEIDCIYFLDYWNAISDLAYSVGEKFYGNEDTNMINSIYNKLFYGNNLPAMIHEGETFIPDWATEEVNELTAVIKDGIRVLNTHLRAM